jgi:hypothetical protein
MTSFVVKKALPAFLQAGKRTVIDLEDLERMALLPILLFI